MEYTPCVSRLPAKSHNQTNNVYCAFDTPGLYPEALPSLTIEQPYPIYEPASFRTGRSDSLRYAATTIPAPAIPPTALLLWKFYDVHPERRGASFYQE